MRISYCDLCGSVVKDGSQFYLYVANAADNTPDINNRDSYAQFLGELYKDVKEICPKCKYVIDKIFELRLQNLSKLNEELLGIFKLESTSFQEKKKVKKNEKKEKL